MSPNQTVINQFKEFLLTEAMVDVILDCDGQNLKAHKIVLSAYSPFFRSLFLKNPCEQPIVILKDIKYTELKIIIDFMYCGEVNIAEDQISAVMKTAQTLKVRGLGEVDFEKSQPNGETESPSGDRSENSTSNVSKNQSGDKFCFKWNDHLNVMNEFKNFLSSETMVDVTLGCDGQSLKAHKIILSAYSPFFRSLFLENPCKHPIVILKDIKYTELKSVIDFMYCREVNIAEDQLSAVIKTAQPLKVKGFVTLESQNSQPGDESGNHTFSAESKNQSGDELPHEPICMINVSSWTLMQKQNGDQNVDGGFVTEIKQENMSDHMDVNISHTETTAMSLQSHDADTFIKSEPIEQNFDKSFGSEESFEGSSPNTRLRKILVRDTLPRQPFQSCVQSNMELHEDNTSNSDNQESSSTSSATALRSRRKKKKLKNIPEKSVQQLCNSQKLGNINNLETSSQNPPPFALESGLNNGTIVYRLRDGIPRKNKNDSNSENVLHKSSGSTNGSATKKVQKKQEFKKVKKRPYEKLTQDLGNIDEYIIDYRSEDTANSALKNVEKKQDLKNSKKRPYEKLTEFLDTREKNTVDYRTENTASGMKFLRCVKCSFKTRYTTTFKRHILSRHEKLKTFKCDQCTYRATLKQNLVRHINEVHENRVRFQCTLCSYNCAQHAQLKRHIACVHEHKKPFKCEICDFRSAQKISLKNHIKAVHEQKRDHACSSCTYRCAAAQNLKRHIRLMHEKKKKK